MQSRRKFLRQVGLCTAFAKSLSATAEDRYTFSVLSLLAPCDLIVRPGHSARLLYSTPSDDGIVEAGCALHLSSNSECSALVSGESGNPASFSLEIPDVLRREYFGTLRVTRRDGVWKPVIQMDVETAVRSITGAELPTAGTPIDALCAQAVVARSFLAAVRAPRHPDSDFCDTTHCQFLRSPAPRGAPAAIASASTQGSVVSYQGRLIPSLYSAACGGHTETGERGGFPYLSVPCETCNRLRSQRRGHGFGLCQEGALGLARRGWSWQAIVRLYFPAATLIRLGS